MRHELIALVGGGGKTTRLFRYGSELPGRVVLTTTTKMHPERTDGRRVLLDPTDAELTEALDEHRVVLVWAGVEGEKALGVAPETADRWWELADHVVVEADGSRRRPCKAPADHEPVIPSRTTLLVVVVGASALGAPIAERCHRPERVAQLAGCGTDDVLTPDRAAAVLCSPAGGLKGRPDAAATELLVTGAHGPQEPAARRLAELCEMSFDRVVVAS